VGSIRIVVVLATAALLAAVSLLALAGVRPAQAAFPGANGKIAFEGGYPLKSRTIYTANPDGSALTRLTFGRGSTHDPAWSADGRKLAYTSTRGGNSDIYTMNADGSGKTRLTDNPATDAEPAWSPSGSRIAFSSRRDGNREIYTMKANGSDPRRITNDADNDYDPAWSPDGSTIAYSGPEGIYVTDPSGASLRLLAADTYDPDWSPDGTKIVYSTGSRLGIMDADGTGRIPLTTGAGGFDVWPAWSPNGRKIAFQCAGDRWGQDVCTINADGTGRAFVDAPGDKYVPNWQPGPPLFRVEGDTTVTMLFAEPIGMSGRFTDGARGIAGQELTLWHLPAGAKDYAPVPGAETVTGEDGSFGFEKVRPEENTNYQVRFAGDQQSGLEPAMSPIKAVDVKVLVSLGLSDNRLKRGEPVVISGEVQPSHSGGVNLTIRRNGEKVATKSAQLDESSHYSLAYVPPKAGDYSVVALFPSHEDHAGNGSPKRSFTVVR
jgi:hypothetical protein